MHCKSLCANTASIAILILSVFLTVLNVNVNALHDDQAGIMDWHVKHVGRTRYAVYHDVSPISSDISISSNINSIGGGGGGGKNAMTHSRRIYTAHVNGVLSAMNARNGLLIWRRVLSHPHERMIRAFISRGNGIFTVTDDGMNGLRLLRLWNADTGLLVWEVMLSEGSSSDGAKEKTTDHDNGTTTSHKESVDWTGPSQADPLYRDEDVDTDSLIQRSASEAIFISDGNQRYIAAIDGAGMVKLLRANDGTFIWEKSVSDMMYVQLAVLHDGDPDMTSIVVAIGEDDNTGDLIVRSWMTVTGDEWNPQKIVGGHGAASVRAIGKGLLAITRECSGSVSIIRVESSNVQVVLQVNPFSSEEKKDSCVHASIKDTPAPSSTKPVVVIGTRDGCYSTVTLDSSKVPFKVCDAAAVSVAAFNDDLVLAISEHIDTKAVTRFVNAFTGEPFLPLSGADATVDGFTTSHGRVVDTYFHIFRRKDGSAGYRLLLIGSDHAMVAVQQSKVLWTREEALASPTTGSLLSFPAARVTWAEAEDEFGSTNDTLSRLLSRVSSQVHHWIGLFTRNVPTDDEEAMIAVSEPASRSSAGRSSIKSVVRDPFNLNKIVLLTTAAGKIFGLHSEDGSILWSFYDSCFRPPHRGGGVYVMRELAHLPPLVAFVGRDTCSVGSEQTRIIVLEAVHGNIVNVHSAPFAVATAALLRSTGPDSERPLLLLSEDGEQRWVVGVDGRPSSAASVAPLDEYIHIVNPDHGTMIGYRITVPVGKDTFSVSTAWESTFGPGEAVAAFAASSSTVSGVETNVVAKVFGDRSYVYKYINPHVFAVATVSSSHEEVSIYLIDGVSGSIIHRVTHTGGSGPVHMVRCDNWVVYQYYNTIHQRHEIVSLDLFENTNVRDTSIFSSLRNSPRPQVKTQSFIAFSGIHAMGVTASLHGISNKNLLMALSDGSIYQLDRRLVDPRRPVSRAATESESEEMIMPYQPELSFSALSVPSYNITVHRVRRIIAAPAGLESASVIFSFGLDLFYTRLAPSKTFDMISEEFNYSLLILTTVGLSVGVILTQRLVNRRELQALWR